MGSEGLDRPAPSRSSGSREPAVAHARWLRSPVGMFSPAGARGRLTVLIFHRVHPASDPLFPGEMHAEMFRERVHSLRSWFDIVPLDDAVAALARGALPARALSITFDDGYADNCTVALPILRDLDVHATFFIASGFLDGGVMWNDSVIEAVRTASGAQLDLSSLGLGVRSIDGPGARRALIELLLTRFKYVNPGDRQVRIDEFVAAVGGHPPCDLMMTRAQVRQLAAAGMGIGGHTVNHPILTSLDEASARKEIADGRAALEAIVAQPVKLFAYPNGKPRVDYDGTHVRIARELGFMAAFSTAWGAARADSPRFELPRFTPWDRTSERWGLRLLANFLARPERVSA